MSDGTEQYTDYCFELMGGPAYLDAESNAGLPNAEDCPAAVCGYGVDEAQQLKPPIPF